MPEFRLGVFFNQGNSLTYFCQSLTPWHALGLPFLTCSTRFDIMTGDPRLLPEAEIRTQVKLGDESTVDFKMSHWEYFVTFLALNQNLV